MAWSKDTIAPGKINLYFDITGRLHDGYHTVDTVMQTIEMADQVQASLMTETAAARMFNDESGVIPEAAKLGPALSMSIETAWFSAAGTWLTEAEVMQNTCFKAAGLFWEHAASEEVLAAGPGQRLIVRLTKRIPAEAGLGGGSADAAALLDLLWQVYGKPFPYEELEMLAARTGADVKFCLKGGTRHCTGIGDRLAWLPALPVWELLIVKPEQGSSTPEAFRRYDELEAEGVSEKLAGVKNAAAFRTKLTEIAFNASVSVKAADDAVDLSELQMNGGNVFTPIVEEKFPKVRVLLDSLRQMYPAALAGLSGSGTSCFVLFGARDGQIEVRRLHQMLDDVIGQGRYRIFRTRLKKGRFGTEQ